MNEIEIVQKRKECLEQIAELQKKREALLEEFDSCKECENRSIYTACPKHKHIGTDIDLIDVQIKEIDDSMPINDEDIVEFFKVIHQELH